MIQLIVNTNMLREIDERKLINSYARYVYENEVDVTDDNKIIENLKILLDWDKLGSNGLGIFCSKYETIKRNDWPKLIKVIKEHIPEIEVLSRKFIKNKIIENNKKIDDALEALERHRQELFGDPNYQESNRGKKGKPCEYKGKTYKNRQECIYKEGITKNQLYQYLKKTGQV